MLQPETDATAADSIEGETADTFLHWARVLNPLTLVVYSDGSLSSQGAASYGFTIHQGNFPVLDGSGRLGPAEVFDAEATGALQDLRAALNLQESVSRNIIICLDNLAAATCLRGTPSRHLSNQYIFIVMGIFIVMLIHIDNNMDGANKYI
ncbi:hypothetical protein FocnCong_v016267 [Fusarium oxysporum f. sp. conglutinans]|nr:hypothetical protein FocnCong_v016267 [Fusarium oxysporum f. sp. conglutinans]